MSPDSAGSLICFITVGLLVGIPVVWMMNKSSKQAQFDGLVSAAKARAAAGVREIGELKIVAKGEPGVEGTADLRAQLARIKASLEVGSDINAYRGELATLVAVADLCRTRSTDAAPALTKLIELVVGYHREALQHWVQMEAARSAHTTGSWSGGGFGLEGALKGALMAGVLNSFQDNTAKVQELLSLGDVERQTAWALATECQAAIFELPVATPSTQVKCANCDKVLGRLEKRHKWNGHDVCAECHQRLG